MNKKLLIICYYYPPENSIPSWRPYSWANYFADRGYNVDVVCRYWKGEKTSWETHTLNATEEKLVIDNSRENLTVHYLPKPESLKNIARKVAYNKITSKIGFFYAIASGNFHFQVDAYYSFKNYIINNLGNKKYDTIIVTSPPLNVVRLGYDLKNIFPSSKLVCDFRDSMNNDLLSNLYRPGTRDKVVHTLYKFYVTKWLKKYDLVLSVCQPILDIMVEDKKKEQMVVFNGYEKNIFKDIPIIPTNKFVISSVGSIYEKQDYKIVLKGMKDFFELSNKSDIFINIIGACESNKKFCEDFRRGFPSENINIKGRIHRKEALSIVKNSNILFYPGWKNYRGIYSGKIFEYLASYNNIIVAPSDNDVLELLLKETGAGITGETSEDVTKYLHRMYNQWKYNGEPVYNGKREKIEFYSRENQAEQLENALFS